MLLRRLPLPWPARPAALVAALVAALGLGGCAVQPTATLVRPEIAPQAAQAHHDLLFVPARPELAPGELTRLHRFLRPLAVGPQDDVVLTLGRSGSGPLDLDRIKAVRAALAPVPARLRVIMTPGFSDRQERPDAALVQVLRVQRVRVDCRNGGRTREALAYLTPLPRIGCANAINLAAMTAVPRDLMAPRRLEGSDARAAVGAVERYRAGDRATPAPLAPSGGG